MKYNLNSRVVLVSTSILSLEVRQWTPDLSSVRPSPHVLDPPTSGPCLRDTTFTYTVKDLHFPSRIPILKTFFLLSLSLNLISPLVSELTVED